MSYEAFREKVRDALAGVDHPLTWTEVRTKASLPQKYPNNRWVHRMETDIGLVRERDAGGKRKLVSSAMPIHSVGHLLRSRFVTHNSLARLCTH